MRPMNKQRPRGGRNNNNNRPRHHQMGPNRNFDSNGPDVKIRGTASHIFERYCQLARDANASGDRVGAENYLQHAEHYYRIMLANGLVQQYNQMRQQQQNGNGQPMPPGAGPQPMMGNGEGGEGNNNEGGEVDQGAEEAPI